MGETVICDNGFIPTWCVGEGEWQDFACPGCVGCVEATS